LGVFLDFFDQKTAKLADPDQVVKSESGCDQKEDKNGAEDADKLEEFCHEATDTGPTRRTRHARLMVITRNLMLKEL
jgi:hypothetical protein